MVACSDDLALKAAAEDVVHETSSATKNAKRIQPFEVLVPDTEHRNRITAFQIRINKVFNVKDALKMFDSAIPVQSNRTKHLRMACSALIEGLDILRELAEDAYAVKFIAAPLMLFLKLVNAQDDMMSLWRWNERLVLASNLRPIGCPMRDVHCRMLPTAVCRADLRVVDPTSHSGWSSLPEFLSLKSYSTISAHSKAEFPDYRFKHVILMDMTDRDDVCVLHYGSMDYVRLCMRGDTMVQIFSCGPTCGTQEIGLGYISLVVAYASGGMRRTLEQQVINKVLRDKRCIIDTHKFSGIPTVSEKFVTECAYKAGSFAAADDVFVTLPEHDLILCHSGNVASPAWYVACEHGVEARA